MTIESSPPLSAFSDQLATLTDQAGQFTVGIQGRRRGVSSGIHWQPGIIVTSEESLKRDEPITVVLPQGQTVGASVVGRDATTDVAVLRLEPGSGVDENTIPTASLAPAEDLRLGHLVLGLGRNVDRGLIVSLGMISVLAGPWRSMSGGQIDQYIRPELSAYGSLAGGPLVNLKGQVIGFNTSGPRGSLLTIPATTIQRVVPQLLSRGRIRRGYLGVGMQSVRLPDSLRVTLNVPNRSGVMIVSLEPDSPADRGGVLLGDVLVALDQTVTEEVADVQAYLTALQPGQSVTVKLMRGGTIVELLLPVGERPSCCP